MKRIVVSIGSSILALAAAISAQAQTYSNAVQALNPVAYWPLTESTAPSGGLYIATNSGTAGAAGNGYYETWWQTNGNPGQLTNGNSIVHIAGAIVGDSDTAMQDGVVGQYVVIPRTANGAANPVATITAPFSIEAWIFPTNNGGTLKPILAEGFNNIINTNLYDQVTTEGTAIGMFNGFVYFNVFNGNAIGNPKSEIDTAGLPLNQWYHIVATFDGTNQSLFTNGVLVRTTATPANSFGQRYVVDPVSPLVIGGGNELGISGGANGPSFGSGIDEVAIYGTNLTAAQILTHYQNGTNGSRSTPYAQVITNDNPRIYLRLDEPAFTGPSVTSMPVASNYGSLGAAANGFYLPGTTPGVAGPNFGGFGGSSAAVALNGFNAGVDVGNGALPSQLNPVNHQPMTVTAWFKGNPADCFGRFQIIAGHSDSSWRLALDTVGGNHFNPGNGPELQYINAQDVFLNGGFVNDGDWHFLAGVSDGTNDFMYLDGVLVKSGTGEGVVSTGTAQDVILGGDPQYLAPQPTPLGGGGRWFDGSLAQVAFYTNALTGSQVSGLYSAAGVAPFIVQQPVSKAVFSGATASVPAIAGGSTPLSYQWYNNSGNTPVGGQTTSALTFSPAVAGNAGSYYLVVNNSFGAVTSAVIQVTVSASSVTPYNAAIMQLNPVGYWPLNESIQPPAGVYIATNLGTLGASANGFYQSWYQPMQIGNTNTFFATNSTRHMAGITGDGDQAMSTGAAGQYVVLPRFTNGVVNSNATISGSPINGAFTVEAWIALGTNSGLRPIITEGRNQTMGGLTNNPPFTNAEYGFSLGQFSSLLYFQTYSGKTFANGGNAEIDTANLQTNVWYHVVAGFDGANIFVYTNGVQVSSKPSSYVPDPVSPLIIGSGTDVPAGNGGLEFIGGIDDVAVYPTNLSATQVLAHFNATNGVNYAATILADSPSIYYRLDEPAFNSYPSRSTYPVAYNYGNVGAAGNGAYEPGTAVGAAGPTFPGLGSGTAVAINGDYGAVDVGNGQIPLALNPVGNAPQTIVAWFQLDPADARFQEIASRGDNSYRLAINGNNNSGGSTAPYDNEYNPGNNPQPGFANLNDVLTNNARFNDGNWHMVAGVSDGSTASLYLDGQLAKQAAGVGSLAGTNWDLLIGTSPAHIIPLATGANLRYLLGQIAQVAYFTNALTATQIQQIENAVGSPLSISVEPPATQTNNVGTAAILTTVVRGSSPAFQWYSLNTNTLVSTPVAGQTNASLVFNPANLSENGSYYLIATNAFNAVTSTVCQLTIVGPPQLISQSANDLRVFVGTTPFIRLSAIGPSLTFQWRSNNTAIPNATNTTYTLTMSDTSSAASNVYSCVITNSFGSTNATVPVVVLADPTAPYPTTVLGDRPSYYFRLDEPGIGFPNDGVTGYDYAGGQNAYYTNTDLGEPGYSSATDPLETAAGFGTDVAGEDCFLGQGSPYLDLATPTNNNAEFSVECWVNSAVDIQHLDAGIVDMGYGFGGEEFDIDIPNNQLRFYVRNAGGTSFSAASTFSLNSTSGWHHLVGVCDEAAGKLSFYIDGALAATGVVPTNSGISMQTLPLSIGSRVSSNGVPHYDNQFFGFIDDVAIYNYALTASQVQSHYFIAGIAPVITQVSPQSTAVNPGSTVSFTVTATGTQPFSYEWLDPSSTPIPGATNATLVLSNVQAAQAGQYTVDVVNIYGTATTNVNLTVNTGPAAISTDLTPLNQNVFAGELVSYTIAAAGDTPIFYQWFQNGAVVPGATNPTFSFTALLGTNTYFCSVSNAESGSSPAFSSTGTVVGMPSTTLNPSNYTDHVKITFSGYNQGQVLQDFPVLVPLSTNIPGFSYAHFASATGGDLRFTDAGGTVIIPSEIDEWHADGTSIVWVQVPTLSSSNNFIWAYWGNPANTTPLPGTNVWVPPSWQGLPSYDVVYHLKESGFPYIDSTGFDPSTNGNPPTVGTGVVGLGETFASPSFLDLGSNNLDSQVTLSAWVNLLPSDTSLQTVWANKVGGLQNAGFAIYVNDFNSPGNGQIEMENGDGVTASLEMKSASGAFPLNNTWHMLTLVLDESNNLGRIYLDTNLVASGAIHAAMPMTNDVHLGTFIGGAFPLNGMIDEARIQFGTNSPAWISAEYLNIAQNATFQTFSNVVSTVANGPVTILFQKSGANLIMTGSGGSAGQPYMVLSSTNVALPMAQWLPVTTNNFDSSGNFSNAVPINSTNKSLFFRIAVP